MTEGMLQMAKDYIDGTGNPLDFELDYGYEFEKRYPKMKKENRELAEVIFDYLMQEGSDHAVDESGEKLRKRIKSSMNALWRLGRKSGSVHFCLY